MNRRLRIIKIAHKIIAHYDIEDAVEEFVESIVRLIFKRNVTLSNIKKEFDKLKDYCIHNNQRISDSVSYAVDTLYERLNDLNEQCEDNGEENKFQRQFNLATQYAGQLRRSPSYR